MSYKLENNESLNIGIKRIILEQIDKSIESLEDYQGNEDDVIHDVRKRGKKIRAALRLVRDSLGKKLYQQENAFFRDLTANLSELRDATSMIAAIHQLNSMKPDSGEKQVLARTRRNLQRKKKKLFEQVSPGELTEDLKGHLKEAKQRYIDLEINAHDFKDIEQSLRRVYTRGRKAFEKAYEDPSVEAFHEWRKRTKYLYYHYRILQNLWPKIFKSFASQTKELSDYLGDDHDYAIILEQLKEEYISFKDPDTYKILENLIHRQKKYLLIEAFPIGKKIYTEKPKLFIKRTGGYWNIWSDQNIKKKVKLPDFA